MALIQDNSRKIHIISHLIVLSISFVSFSERSFVSGKSSPFERVMIDSLAPLQGSISYIYRWVSSFFIHYVANVESSKENVGLKSRIRELEREIHERIEIEQENKRLKEFLSFGEKSPHREILAQIVAWDSTSDFKVIRINKGANSGIRLQSTVITAEGLVGYVFRLTNNFSDVLTILDHNNKIDGIIQRNRAHGIVEGYSNGKCIMKYVNRIEPVVLNDLVITSGLGNIYPKGLAVGSVSRIERESHGITQKIEISPAVDFSKLEEVVVLLDVDKDIHEEEMQILNSLEYGKVE